MISECVESSVNGLQKVFDFQARIRYALVASQMNKKELSEKTGVHQSTISRYVAGSMKPKKDAVEKLAAALDVSEDWLWGYNVPMERVSKNPLHRHGDAEFHDVVDKLARLSDEEYESIKRIIIGLTRKD